MVRPDLSCVNHGQVEADLIQQLLHARAVDAGGVFRFSRIRWLSVPPVR